MGRFIVEGGKQLKGELTVHGSKNAVLPVLASTILNSGINVIKNCPALKDVDIMLKILKKLGCIVSFNSNKAIIDSTSINSTLIPDDLAAEMRSSIIFLGPMLARFGEVTISYPGGCVMELALFCEY